MHRQLKQYETQNLHAATPSAAVNHEKDEKRIVFEQAYRDLLSKIIMMGMLKPNYSFYTYKQISTLMIWCTAMWIVYAYDSLTIHALAATLMGLHVQQSGLIAHDAVHHQMYVNRRLGDYTGLFWGTLMQGLSVQWWKNKHNGHHAVPNLQSSAPLALDGDPDIDTMPVLAWSLKQAQSYRVINDGKDPPVAKFMIKYQAWFFFPLIALVAPQSWLNESIKIAFGLGTATENAEMEMKRKGLQYPISEKVCITLHYVWRFAFISAYGKNSWMVCIGLYLLMNSSFGLAAAHIIGLNHNGMATYEADESRPDFWTLQVSTARNIVGGRYFPEWFADWYFGGLHRQIEHHLFPTMPRHNLRKVGIFVESFCKEWNVPYHETDLVVGTIEVLKHLNDVSTEFVSDFVKDGPY